MSDMTFEPDASVESGVWWDGVLNPMSPDGIRAAMSEEDPDQSYKASDIRWVAWPGLGSKVHVSQVDELLPIWADIQGRRMKHGLILSFLSSGYLWFQWWTEKSPGFRAFDLGLGILFLLGLIVLIRNLVRFRRDPRAWGLVRSRSDARSDQPTT